MLRFRSPSLGLLACILAAGCSSSSTVSGDVTFEGEPVEDGMITFVPADGKGPVVGAAIVKGRYTAGGLLPGPRIAQITAVKAVNFARSSEEMAARAKTNPSGLIDPADLIPADALGNNAAIELAPGGQTYDFALKKPSR